LGKSETAKRRKAKAERRKAGNDEGKKGISICIWGGEWDKARNYPPIQLADEWNN
jgi:hypothetical protein